MRKILIVLLSLCPMWTWAIEEPFIAAPFYKKNISLEVFKENPRQYFRSESAFDLLVDYVGDEIGQEISDAEFIALMRSDRVRARECPTTEEITTGAYDGGEFSWLNRFCREGEQITQTQVGERWLDLFSLNCLNAVEDKVPVPVPPPVVVNPPPMSQAKVRRKEFSSTSTPQSEFLSPTFVQTCYIDHFTPGIFLQGGQGVQSRGYINSSNN